MEASGKVIIKISKTGQTYEVEASDLDFQQVEVTEREMGPEIHYEANIEHLRPGDGKGPFTLSVWEYPEGAYNYHEFDIEKDEVVEDNMNFDFSEKFKP